jgi:hypothetical protein
VLGEALLLLLPAVSFALSQLAMLWEALPLLRPLITFAPNGFPSAASSASLVLSLLLLLLLLAASLSLSLSLLWALLSEELAVTLSRRIFFRSARTSS